MRARGHTRARPLRYGGRMSAATRSTPIRRVAVLGAGVMGAGIAAHCANAGIPVLLLDIVKPDLEKLKKQKPAALMHVRNAQLIKTGLFETHLAQLKDYDLIVEAIIERLDIKK